MSVKGGRKIDLRKAYEISDKILFVASQIKMVFVKAFRHALLDVVTTSYSNIDEILHSFLVFVDYKKAFDTVCHEILSAKLNNYSIRGSALNLIFKLFILQNSII